MAFRELYPLELAHPDSTVNQNLPLAIAILFTGDDQFSSTKLQQVSFGLEVLCAIDSGQKRTQSESKSLDFLALWRACHTHRFTFSHYFTGSEKGDKLEGFLRAIEPLDASHYVSRLAPTVLLFQSAHMDPGVPDKDAQDFFDAASEPKQLKWYDTGHEVLDIAAISDRSRFLSSQLHLAPIEPILKKNRNKVI